MSGTDTASILSRLQRVLGGGAPIPPPPPPAGRRQQQQPQQQLKKSTSSSSSAAGGLKPLEQNFVLSSDARSMLLRKGNKSSSSSSRQDVIGTDGGSGGIGVGGGGVNVMAESSAESAAIAGASRLDDELTRLAGLLSDFEPSQLLASNNGAAFDAWRAETLRMLLVCSGHSSRLAHSLGEAKSTLLSERVQFLEKIDASQRSNEVARTAIDSLEEQNRALKTKVQSLERETAGLKELLKKAETTCKAESKKAQDATKAAIDARTDLALALAKAAESNALMAKSVEKRLRNEGVGNSGGGGGASTTTTNLNAAIGALVMASNHNGHQTSASAADVNGGDDKYFSLSLSTSNDHQYQTHLQAPSTYSSYSFPQSSTSSSSTFSPSISSSSSQKRGGGGGVASQLLSSSTPTLSVHLDRNHREQEHPLSSSRSRSPTPHFMLPTMSHIIRKTSDFSFSSSSSSSSSQAFNSNASLFGTHLDAPIRPQSPNARSRSNSPTNASSSSPSRRSSRANSPSISKRSTSPSGARTNVYNLSLHAENGSEGGESSRNKNRMNFVRSGGLSSASSSSSSSWRERNKNEEEEEDDEEPIRGYEHPPDLQSKNISNVNSLPSQKAKSAVMSTPTLEELSSTSLSETLSSLMVTPSTSQSAVESTSTKGEKKKDNREDESLAPKTKQSTLNISEQQLPQQQQQSEVLPAEPTGAPPTVADSASTALYDEMSKDDLRKACEARGLSIEGKLKELRTRLREDDTSKNSSSKACNPVEGGDGQAAPQAQSSSSKAPAFVTTDFDAMGKEELRSACVARGFENAEGMKMKEMRAKLREAEDAEIVAATASAEASSSLSQPSSSSSSYETLGKEALREECEKRGLSKDGKLKELRARLLEDDEKKAAETVAATAAPARKESITKSTKKSSEEEDKISVTESTPLVTSIVASPPPPPPPPASVTAPLLSSPLQSSSPRAGHGASSWTRHITVKKLPSSPQGNNNYDNDGKSQVAAVFAPTPTSSVPSSSSSMTTSSSVTSSSSASATKPLSISSGVKSSTHPTLKKLLESSSASPSPVSLDYKTSSVQDLLVAAMQFGQAPPPPLPSSSSSSTLNDVQSQSSQKKKTASGEVDELITNAALLRTASSLGSTTLNIGGGGVIEGEREPRV